MSDEPNTPVEGRCTYCDEITGEGRFWLDGDGEIVPLPGEWVFAHDKCRKLSAIRLEEIANRKLGENPDDPGLRAVARLFTVYCDRVLAGDKPQTEKQNE